jgi:uncharacterized protein (TIGR03032 family)
MIQPAAAMTDASHPAEAPPGPQPRDRQTAVTYDHSANLPMILDACKASLVVSTYQAGKVFTVGTQGGRIVIAFHHFEQAMGIARTPTGLAVGTKRQIWMLPAAPPGLADRVQPAGSRDVAFLARQAHFTGPVMGHDLAWSGGALWLVNTLFNSLCTIEPDASFVPRWRPPFISELAAGDRCHLNGLAADDTGPRFVTCLGQTDTVNGWRDGKRDGGCLVDVTTAEVVVAGLSMPHSPRLHAGELWLLNSGHGRLERYDAARRSTVPVAELPGYTRGLDLHGGLAFVGLSRIRETAVFGGLPLDARRDTLRCGIGVVEVATGLILAWLFFGSGVEEIFDVRVLPGYRNPAISGPYPDVDDTETIWVVPGSPEPREPRAAPRRRPAGTQVVIHARPDIAWHAGFAAAAAEGFRAVGVACHVTNREYREDVGLPILLGTSSWRGIEAAGPFLLVDRCSFGDPGTFVSLVRDGHGRRGDHRVPPQPDGTRWSRYGVPVAAWSACGERIVLCGQTETYSPHYRTLNAWYSRVGPACTHYRPHPVAREAGAPTLHADGLPMTDGWDECRLAVTLNSSVGVDTVLRGIPTVTMDEAAMAWAVTGHAPHETLTPDRTEWLHWLAWTQWTYDEVRTGLPWRRLLD